MKRILLLVLAFTAAIGSLSAQNYIVVNSEKVFKSIDEYNKALDTLDQLAKSYQQQIHLYFDIFLHPNAFHESHNALTHYYSF